MAGKPYLTSPDVWESSRGFPERRSNCVLHLRNVLLLRLQRKSQNALALEHVRWFRKTIVKVIEGRVDNKAS